MIIDAHVHLHRWGGDVQQSVVRALRYADRLGIDHLICSMTLPLTLDPSPEHLIEDNSRLLEAVSIAPDRISGLIYGSAGEPELTVRLLEEHVTNGPLVGLKIWHARRCTEPEYGVIAAAAGDAGIPVLQCAWLNRIRQRPTESTPWHLAQAAEQHPNTQFVMAHCGGNWEHGSRIVADLPNVCVDVSGGDPEAGVVEYAVSRLGPERVLFGSDAAGRSYGSQLAKVTGAAISDDHRRAVLGENARRVYDL